MDQKYIDDHHVVARFLADQLSDSDREAFEAFCLANPDMFRQIEAAARFKVGLAKLEKSKQLQPLLETRSADRSFPLRHAAMIAGLLAGGTLIYGAVASLRVPVMGATVTEVSGRFREKLPVVGELELLLTMRSSQQSVPTMTLPLAPSAIRLRLSPGIEEAGSYHAELRRVAGNQPQIIATVENLKPDENLSVVVYLSSAKLEPGDYEIEIVPSEKALGQETGLAFKALAFGGAR